MMTPTDRQQLEEAHDRKRQEFAEAEELIDHYHGQMQRDVAQQIDAVLALYKQLPEADPLPVINQLQAQQAEFNQLLSRQIGALEDAKEAERRAFRDLE
jgi:hypothetical protein